MSWLITGTEKTPIDPVFNNVSLLLHGDGANGSTTIVDSSPSPKTVTAYDNAQISTAIADPFGNNTGVLSFDGAGDYLTVPSSAAFEYGTQDYTIEMWLYLTHTGANLQLILDQRSTGLSLAPAIYTQYGVIYYFLNGANRITSSSVTQNTWTHLALSRASGSTRLFLNGAQSGSTYADTNSNTSSLVKIGSGYNNLDPVSGYIDDLRITKGVARYTSNFTPPTAPFPDA